MATLDNERNRTLELRGGALNVITTQALRREPRYSPSPSATCYAAVLPQDEAASAPFNYAAALHLELRFFVSEPRTTISAELLFNNLKPMPEVFDALDFYGVLIHMQSLGANCGRAILR